jgi:acyl carrier protein
MTTTEQLHTAFATALQIDPAIITDAMAYNQQPEWDSVAHMALVAELESVFDVMLDTEDILAMSSVGAARTILGKYGVAF